MTDIYGINNAVRQGFAETAPVVNLVAVVDYIFNKLGISESSMVFPLHPEDPVKKVAAMTNTYLKPTRISRNVMLGSMIFFYGRKFNLLPEIFETIPYEAPADVLSFVENRIKQTLTDYLSIHKGNFRLNLDVKDGIIINLVNIGFDGQFAFLSKNAMLTVGDLEKIILSLMET